MAKKRRKKSRVNPVREWISDNLRYLLLILVIVIAALVAFLVYRGLSNRAGSSTAQVTSVGKETSSKGPVSTTVASSKEETESTSKTEVVTATPTPTPTATPTPTPEPTPAVTLTEDSPEVMTVVQNYFYQLQVDGQSETIEYYDNLHVHTLPGPEDGTYVAYADYDYKYWNYDSVIPGLTEFYLETGEDGFLQVVDTIPSDVQEFIDDARQSDEIQSLIQSVQTKYQEVVDSDPELSSFISGLQ